MKKATLSRILGLALALVLVLSTSVAFALPSGTSAIEGLPEMPTVPTMVTSAKGYDVTITLSEKLNWLNFVQNWQWLPINFSEDGLTGTYSTADLATQPGYGTYQNGWRWTDVDWWAGDTKEDEVETYSYDDITKYYYEDDIPMAEKRGYYYPSDKAGFTTEDMYWPGINGAHITQHQGGQRLNAGYFYQVPTILHREDTVDMDGEPISYYWAEWNTDYIESEEDEDVEAAIVAKIEAAQKKLKDHYTAAGDKDAAAAVDDFGWYMYDEDGRVIVGTNNNTHLYGIYELDDDFAYDGEAADGTHVRYGRYGECVQIGVTLTGVNFLGTDKTPVKTTVYWRPLEHYGKNVWNWYINNITEEYEDGSKLEAHFSSSKGGKLLGTKVIAAE